MAHGIGCAIPPTGGLVIQSGGRAGTARLGTRGAPYGSGVMVGVVGEQTFGLGDGDQAVVGANERERRFAVKFTTHPVPRR